MRGVLVAAALVAVMFAGCTSQSTAPQEPTAEPQAFEDLTVTESKGLIRGLVISETIKPIAGAEVKLVSADKVELSDEQGAFVFTDLEPGDYFLAITKPGYFDVQASAVVVAGVAEPPIVKVQLVFDAENQPFSELIQWTGFFGCGLGTNFGGVLPPPAPQGLGFNPCAVDAIACSEADVCVMGTSNTHFFDFGAAQIPDFAQAEMVWTGTQPLGNALNLGWHDISTTDFKSTSGESPLILPTNSTEILAAHDPDITGLLVRVFPGNQQELTITMQQRYDIYVTYFYGFVPREGWNFVADGACSSPEQCG